MIEREKCAAVTVEQEKDWQADHAIFRLAPVAIDRSTLAADRVDFQLECVGGTKTSVRLTVRTAKTLAALLSSFVETR